MGSAARLRPGRQGRLFVFWRGQARGQLRGAASGGEKDSESQMIDLDAHNGIADPGLGDGASGAGSSCSPGSSEEPIPRSSCRNGCGLGAASVPAARAPRANGGATMMSCLDGGGGASVTSRSHPHAAATRSRRSIHPAFIVHSRKSCHQVVRGSIPQRAPRSGVVHHTDVTNEIELWRRERRHVPTK